jgi:hypothetical protein
VKHTRIRRQEAADEEGGTEQSGKEGHHVFQPPGERRRTSEGSAQLWMSHFETAPGTKTGLEPDGGRFAHDAAMNYAWLRNPSVG